LIEFVELAFEQSGVRELSLVFSYESGRKRAGKRVFDDFGVLCGAEQDAHGRVLMRLAYVAVEGFEVEFQFAEVLGLKLVHLQLKGDEAVEGAVEKEEVYGEIAPPDLHRIFRADETEVATQFTKEIFQPGD